MGWGRDLNEALVTGSDSTMGRTRGRGEGRERGIKSELSVVLSTILGVKRKKNATVHTGGRYRI